MTSGGNSEFVADPDWYASHYVDGFRRPVGFDHTLTAAVRTTGDFVLGVGCWHEWGGRDKPLGARIKELVTIVSPRTFARWIDGKADKKSKATAANKKPGRPKTPGEVRDLILRIARETGFGYTRILGELRKLGIRNVSRSTVVNILKEAGLDPSPERTKGIWTDFVERHAKTLWASDFVGVKSFTTSGIVDLYVLFFLHVAGFRQRGDGPPGL